LTIEKDIIKADKMTAVRGKWSRKIEFLLSCIGFAVGLGNVWRFPIRVYESIPILLLEMGIGQLSGRGPTKVFKLVPIIYGLGWAMIVGSIFIEIYYAVIIAWSYFYLFGSFTKNMPWTVCAHKFNSPNCLESGTVKFNTSEVYVSSTSEYWDYYVTGFVKYPERVPYVMNENPGSPQWRLAPCLLLVWLVAAIVLMFGVKISGKVMYFAVLYPYFALFCLFVLGCTLPGAANGVRFYLEPDWSKIYNPTNLRGAVEQLFFSSSLAMGGMIAYSSYNEFRDNFYRDAIIVIFIDFFTSLLAGFAVFPILGYIAQRTGLPISKVVTSGSNVSVRSRMCDASTEMDGGNESQGILNDENNEPHPNSGKDNLIIESLEIDINLKDPIEPNLGVGFLNVSPRPEVRSSLPERCGHRITAPALAPTSIFHHYSYFLYSKYERA